MHVERQGERPEPVEGSTDAHSHSPTVTVGEFLDIGATTDQVDAWISRNPGQIEDAARHGWSQFTALAPAHVPTEGEIHSEIGPTEHRSGTAYRPLMWSLLSPTATFMVLRGDLMLRAFDDDQTHLEIQAEFRPWFPDDGSNGERSRDAMLYSLRSFVHLLGHRFGLDRHLAADGWR
ncbi:MAG: hypothetical protein AAFO29_02385 [Actinomycetota bacterium]